MREEGLLRLVALAAFAGSHWAHGSPELPEDCETESGVRRHGTTFMKDCNVCLCDDGQTYCTNKPCLPPPKHCRTDDGWKLHQTTFTRSCNICFCDDGTTHCTQRACEDGGGGPTRRMFGFNALGPITSLLNGQEEIASCCIKWGMQVFSRALGGMGIPQG